MQTLYEDKYCTITNVCVIIKKYYFPLATSRTIMFQDVKKISLEDGNNVRHVWGPCSHSLNHWFHYDSNRITKEKFISFTIKGQRIMPALTPEDFVIAFNALRKHFEEIDRKSVFRSQKDSQTVLDHQQAKEQHEAMKRIEEESSKNGFSVHEQGQQKMEHKMEQIHPKEVHNQN